MSDSMPANGRAAVKARGVRTLVTGVVLVAVTAAAAAADPPPVATAPPGCSPPTADRVALWRGESSAQDSVGLEFPRFRGHLMAEHDSLGLEGMSTDAEDAAVFRAVQA